MREGEVRRDATMDDYQRFTKLAQSFEVLDSAGGVICEPNDTPLDSRHLDMTYALQTLTDKVYMGNVVSQANAADTLAMSAILFGSREAIEETPATISLINCNSPLRWDDRMLEAQFEYSAAGQPVAAAALSGDRSGAAVLIGDLTAREAEVRYSVVVANQPVRDVLLAMARETRVNFDIHPGIEGSINLNAIDQTLKQILTRIARQVDVRWETDGQTIIRYAFQWRVAGGAARAVDGTAGGEQQAGLSEATNGRRQRWPRARTRPRGSTWSRAACARPITRRPPASS